MDSLLPSLEWYTSAGGWALSCLLAAFLCGWRARGRGYATGLFAGLGLLLGLGAYPLSWLITRQNLHKTSSQGTGFTPGAEPSPDSPHPLEGWLRSYQLRRQLALFVYFSLAGGVTLSLLMIAEPFIPVLFPQTAEEYQRHFTPFYLSQQFNLIKRGLMLLFPLFAYALHAQLGYRFPVLGALWQRLDRLWLLYAYRTGLPEWRALLPEEVKRRTRTSPDPTPAELEQIEPLREQLDQWLFRLPPTLAPMLLLGYFVLVTVLCRWGILAYRWLGNPE